MEDFTWLKLNDAAQMIASRLPKLEPNKPSNPKTVLNESRRQLLDQAHFGSLEVQGKRCNPELEELLPLGDWEVVNASFWDSDHRPGTGGLSDINLSIIWENNCFSYEDDQSVCWGFDTLRVREADIDRLWPPTQTVAARQAQAADVGKRDPGGAPRRFRDDLLIEIIRIADLDALPESRAEMRQQLRGLSLPLPHWDEGGPSDSTVHDVVKLVYDRLQKP
jgi:hypothetical protein